MYYEINKALFNYRKKKNSNDLYRNILLNRITFVLPLLKIKIHENFT